MDRCCRWLATVGLLVVGGSLTADSAHAQFFITPDSAAEPSAAGAVIAPQRELTQALDRANTLLKQSQYPAAVRLLQEILDQPEDYFVDRELRRSLKTEVLDILAKLPSEGRESYELLFGITARELLNEALERHDRPAVAEVMRRFFHTQAGYEAAHWLASELLDQGSPLAAALTFERLRSAPMAAAPFEPMLTLKTAVAWGRAGRPDRSAALLKELKAAAPNGRIRLGGRNVPLFAQDDQALPWLAQTLGVQPEFASLVSESWTMPGGGPSRNVSAVPANPVGEPAWQFAPLEALALDPDPEVSRKRANLIQAELDRQEAESLESNRPLLPAAVPLVVGDRVIFRTLTDVTALHLTTGEIEWRSVLVDPTLQQLFSQGMINERPEEASLLAMFLRQRTVRDQTANLLSSDGQYVYAIEELGFIGFSPQATGLQHPLEPSADNKLVAYEAKGGRFRWEVGGPRGEHPLDLAGHFFLGPPLPMDGLLYVLAEYSGEIRLLVLRPQPERQTVEVVWVQPLLAPNVNLSLNTMRRMAGLMPSYADGILLCPTGCGATIAVDLQRRQLAWGVQYASTVNYSPRNPRMLFGRFPEQELAAGDQHDAWLDSAPIVAEGRVLLAPRDSRELYCLNLTDGELLWSKPRGQALAVIGVHQGLVFVLGRTQIDALRLSDGDSAWKEPLMIPLPSGRGVRVGNMYHLPLTTGEIATIDLAAGRIIARSQLPNGEIPGNLVAAGGTLVSQSTDSVLALTSLGEIETSIAARLRENPEDAAALALRGQLRLHQGDEVNGLDDLRRAVRFGAGEEVQSALVAVLLDGLQSDFARYRAIAEEVQEQVEDSDRRDEFLRLYGNGLQEIGERRAAFRTFVKLMQPAENEPKLERVNSLLTARNDHLVRAALSTLYESATPDEREEMDRELREQVAASEETPEALRRLVVYCGELPAGEMARMRLAKLLTADDDALELEFHLQALRKSSDAEVAAFATARLAKLLIEKSLAAQAEPLLNELSDRFAEQICLDDKTGRELADEWRSDPDIQAELKRTSPWPLGKIRVTNSAERSSTGRSLAVDVIGSPGPYFTGWFFRVDQQRRFLAAYDADGHQRWRIELPRPEPGQQDFRFAINPYGQTLLIQDHLLLFALGDTLMAIDALSQPAEPKVLWEQPLFESSPGPARGVNIRGAILPNGRPQIVATDGYGRLLGLVGAVTPNLVCYQIGSRLHAVDPLSGETLWTRQELPPSGEIRATPEAVLIYSPDNTEALVLRAADGERLATRIIPASEHRLWMQGSLLVSWRETDGRQELTGLDVLSGDELWQRTFAAGSQTAVVSGEELAVLEPSGRFVVLNLADGRERVRQMLDPVESLQRIAVFRSEQQYLLVASGPEVTENNRRITGFDVNSIPVHGRAYGIDRSTGERLWMQPIERLALDLAQPDALPVLVFAARTININPARPFPQQGFSNPLSVLILDRRTGAIVHQETKNINVGAMQLEPDPENARIIVNFFSWRLELKCTDTPDATSPETPDPQS